jgi:hypothetical protein
MWERLKVLPGTKASCLQFTEFDRCTRAENVPVHKISTLFQKNTRSDIIVFTSGLAIRVAKSTYIESSLVLLWKIGFDMEPYDDDLSAKPLECSICIEPIIPSERFALACGHIYHTTCVISLIEKRLRKCPICRTRVEWTVSQIRASLDSSPGKSNARSFFSGGGEWIDI